MSKLFTTFAAAVVLACWLATSALAADITIVGPTTPIKPKDVAWLTIEGVGVGSTATFFPSDQLTAGPPHLVPAHAMFQAEKVGKYTVHAMVVDWEKRTLTPLTYAITVGTAPDPDPDPDPNPTKKWQIMLIHESSDLGTLPRAQVELLSSLTLRDELRAAGHYVLGVYDDDSCASGQCSVVLRPWFAAVAGETMPRVAIAPIGGGNVKDFPLPVDKAGLLKLLQEAE